jgi:hypothetical protein
MYCTGYAVLWYAENVLLASNVRNFPPGYADLIFDQGEPFHGHVLERWKHPKEKGKPLYKGIRAVTEADMRFVPGLQMADMLAWSINRPYGQGGHEEVCEAVVDAIPRTERTFEYEELRKPNHTALETIAALRLPHRKPMK